MAQAPLKKAKSVVTIDPSMEYERMLHFQERHVGWVMFRAVFWGVFIFIVGLLVLVHIGSTFETFVGWVIIIFSIFFMIFGFAMALHLKLMKKYA